MFITYWGSWFFRFHFDALFCLVVEFAWRYVCEKFVCRIFLQDGCYLHNLFIYSKDENYVGSENFLQHPSQFLTSAFRSYNPNSCSTSINLIQEFEPHFTLLWKVVNNGNAMLGHFAKTSELLQKVDHQMDSLIDKLWSFSISRLVVSTRNVIFVFFSHYSII